MDTPHDQSKSSKSESSEASVVPALTMPANQPATIVDKPASKEAEAPKSNPFAATKKKEKAKGNPFQKSFDKIRRQRLYLGIGAGIIALLGLIYYFTIASRGAIIILEPKQDFTVTLNDRPTNLKNNRRGLLIPTYPGLYRLKIEKKNYQPFIQDIRVGRGQTITVRPIFALFGEEQASGNSIDYVRPSLDQKSVFYLGDNRRTIYRLEITNQVQVALTDRPLRNVKDIQWSTDTDVSLIVQSDGIYLQEIPKYDFQSQAVLRVGGTDINSPVWDAGNPERMAFIYTPSSGEKSLVFADKRIQKLERKLTDELRDIIDPKLVWSKDSALIMLIGRSSTDSAFNNIWIYTTADGNFKQLTTGGNVLDASFSPNSDIILYESYSSDPTNPLGSVLSTMKIDGSENNPLNITGKVARAAWRDNSSFYLPETSRNALVLYTLDNKRESIPFTFPSTGPIQGMYYFPENKTLIFYTSNTIYTASLAL